MSSATSQSSPGSAITDISGGTYAEQLAQLEARYEEAVVQRQEARTALRDRRSEGAVEVTADLISHRDAITFRKPNATPEADRRAREQELSAQLLKQMEDRGLIFRATGPGQIEIVDPSISEDFEKSERKMLKARDAMYAFKTEHASDLEAERRKADAEAIRSALDSNDGDRIREVLVPSVAPGSGAMTTHDLPPRQRVTTGA